jgi:hypothetical protein
VSNPEKISTGSFPQGRSGAFGLTYIPLCLIVHQRRVGICFKGRRFVVRKGIPELGKNFADHAIPTRE